MVPTADFRNGMSLLTGSVNVITTDGPAGMAGFTASAVCSVTDQPPTLLVCMNRSSYAHRHFVENKVICVNVLSAEQETVSALFSNRTIPMDERFQRTPWRALTTGAPTLDGALVHFDGEITAIHEAGSHSIFLVEVQGIRLNEQESQGLAYFNRAYHRLGQPPAPSHPAR